MTRAPGFFEHLLELWRLRLTIGFNRSDRRGRAAAVMAFALSVAPAAPLGLTFYGVMRHPVVLASDVWADFIVGLLLFVTSATWVTWPVLSAGVDDHSELSRYASLPISSVRLLSASTLASVFEPRSLVFSSPLLGATVGYVQARPQVSWAVVAAGFVAVTLFNAALARVGLHLVLTVLRQRRSAELIGGGFVVALLLASLLPPVDTEWLLHVNEVGAEAVPDTVLANAALALSRFPTGWFGHLLRVGARGRLDLALADVFAIVELGLVAFVIAWGLLLDFHRNASRGGPVSSAARAANPFSKTRSTFATLVVRELLDLWNNPRARLLASVPFVLGILLKLLSGRALLVFLLGDAADAWLTGGLALYATVVMTSTFSQNAFAYDGHGFTIFLAAPLRLGDVLRAKNVVHGSVGALTGVLAAVFSVASLGAGAALEAGLACAAVLGLVPVLLLAGNVLSLTFPVKFHANLKRRDRLPFVASMSGVLAASLGTAPFAFVVRQYGTARPGLEAVVVLLLTAVVAWSALVVTRNAVERLLVQRREVIFRAVTRE